MTSELPTSSLLSQADPEWSMVELFNRNPSGLRKDHPDQFKRLIAELRAQALRNAQATAAGERVPRAVKSKDAVKGEPAKSETSLDDLI